MSYYDIRIVHIYDIYKYDYICILIQKQRAFKTRCFSEFSRFGEYSDIAVICPANTLQFWFDEAKQAR
jgi:hypothetical protein